MKVLKTKKKHELLIAGVKERWAVPELEDIWASKFLFSDFMLYIYQ